MVAKRMQKKKKKLVYIIVHICFIWREVILFYVPSVVDCGNQFLGLLIEKDT